MLSPGGRSAAVGVVGGGRASGGDTAVHLAARRGNQKLLKLLLAYAGNGTDELSGSVHTSRSLIAMQNARGEDAFSSLVRRLSQGQGRGQYGGLQLKKLLLRSTDTGGDWAEDSVGASTMATLAGARGVTQEGRAALRALHYLASLAEAADPGGE
jgi:hypothetical protein